MQIINPNATGDYHIHSAHFSDGFNTLDEITLQAGRLGLQEIVITDHSQDYLDSYGMAMRTHYNIITNGRWRNIHNDVTVRFGVEADLLTDEGAICDHIQGVQPDFVILSTHRRVYRGDFKVLKTGYLRAIETHGSRIDILGHLCCTQMADYLGEEDVLEIVAAANEADIALELNGSNLVNHRTEPKSLKVMLDTCKRLYINSDAHTLFDLAHNRRAGFAYLESHGYISQAN